MSTVSIEGRWYKAEEKVIERLMEVCGQRDDCKMSALSAERERDEARAELERVKADRDEALVKIKVFLNVAHDAVGHVAAANYPERESLAHKWIDDCYERKP